MVVNVHSNLVNLLLIELGSRPDLGRYWKNNTGVAQADDRFIRYGLPGSPDIIGLTHKGLWVGIECKTGSGRQSQIQKNFQAMIEQNNGVYILARDINEVLHKIEALNCANS